VGIVKVVMVANGIRAEKGSERGDTLIEVTIALAILGLVLLSSFVVATTAFRLGQTARERTQLAEEAQNQMEALRSFRDNHTWQQFRTGLSCGSPTGFCGVDNAMTAACQTTYSFAGARCFSMRKLTVAGVTRWVPQPGGITASLPASVIEISTRTGAGLRNCGYDFELHYRFQPLGGGQPTANRITTRLVNLKYTVMGAPACPS
jgi:prepilin-type N-terminal cleavage/methylation domain-containing protein